MNNYIVYLGAVGWRHEAWRGDFYPEDLPEDWQLSFYNTQFRCVYLPAEYWRNASDEEVANWLQDTQEGFRFVLGTADGFAEDAARRAGRFGERGVLEDGADILWLEGEPDLRDLAQRMQKAAQGGSPLYVISRAATLAQLGKIRELMEVLGV
jgi:uncharacterized protein YecE (DUF72 family)